METKPQIRKRHLAKRNALSAEERHAASRKINENLKAFLSAQKNVRTCGVYGYYPHGTEVSLLLLYAWLLEQEVSLAFPRTVGSEMEFYAVRSMEEFSRGRFGIFEPPIGCEKADFWEAFCLVPGSVFDRMGNRYGYGKGYYDRYFSNHETLYRIGVAYESQLEEAIPVDCFDSKMQAIATEAGIFVL